MNGGIKVKVKVDLYKHLVVNTPIKCSGMARVLKGSISQFHLHIPHSSANGMNYTFAFQAEAGIHLPTPDGLKAELALDGWLVTNRNKCPALGTEHGRPSQC